MLQAQAEQLLSEGDAEGALALTESILERDNLYSPAHFMQAVALLQLQQPKAAAEAAERAYDTAANDRQRMQAAQLVGRARADARQFTRAELWVRRAVDLAETDEDLEIIRSQFEAIRSANPLSVQLSFGISPSNNINGGLDIEEQFFRDENGDILCFAFVGCISSILGPESRALSGVEYNAGADLRYALSESSAHLTTLDFEAFARTFTLSDEAEELVRELDGDLDGSDFSFARVGIGLTHRIRTTTDDGTIILSGSVGKVWSGGSPSYTYETLSVQRDFPVGREARFSISGDIEMQTPIVENDSSADDEQYPTDSSTITAGYSWKRANGDQLRFSIAGRRYIKDDTSIQNLNDERYVDHSMSLSQVFAQDFWGNRISVNGTIGRRRYTDFPITASGRLDDYVTLGMSTVFERWSYYGFSPTFEVSATYRDSDLDEYDGIRMQGGFGLKSNF